MVGYVVGVFSLILHAGWWPKAGHRCRITPTTPGAAPQCHRGPGDDLYLVGEQGLLRKWDSGTRRFVSPSPMTAASSASSGRPGELLICRLRGHAYRSTDDGQHWVRLASPLPHPSIPPPRCRADGQFRLFAQARSACCSAWQRQAAHAASRPNRRRWRAPP